MSGHSFSETHGHSRLCHCDTKVYIIDGPETWTIFWALSSNIIITFLFKDIMNYLPFFVMKFIKEINTQSVIIMMRNIIMKWICLLECLIYVMKFVRLVRIASLCIVNFFFWKIEFEDNFVLVVIIYLTSSCNFLKSCFLLVLLFFPQTYKIEVLLVLFLIYFSCTFCFVNFKLLWLNMSKWGKWCFEMK